MCGGCRVTGRRRAEVRLRRRARVRRPPGRFRRARRAPAQSYREDEASSTNTATTVVRRGERCRRGGPTMQLARRKRSARRRRRRCRQPRTAASAPQLRRGRARLHRGAGRSRKPSAASSARTDRASRGCPVEIDIPGFIRQSRRRDFVGAYGTLSDRTCCPPSAAASARRKISARTCTSASRYEPVAIGRLERFVADSRAVDGTSG